MNILQKGPGFFSMARGTDGRTNKHDGANGLISQVCELTQIYKSVVQYKYENTSIQIVVSKANLQAGMFRLYKAAVIS
jgi:hypothetical protein